MNLVWKPYRKSLAADVVGLWNRAIGQHFPMTLRLLRQNVEGAPGFDANDGTIVSRDDQVVGFVWTQRFREQDPLRQELGAMGWIEAIVVDPSYQRQGLGRDLMAWAMSRLRNEGAASILLGGSIQYFLPGVPAELPGLPDFFARFGFGPAGVVHDLRGNLRGIQAPPAAATAVAAADAAVRPCQPHDVPALMAFLQAEFPGRWRYDIGRFLSRGGAPQDIIILCQGQSVIGFARIHHRRSAFLAGPTYWHRLLRPRYGGLGPIGVAAAMRGKGLGLALLQLALAHLAQLGVEDAVIDWTSPMCACAAER